jgi:hypothetical protein
MTAERIRLTRTELHESVWATPMRTLAKEFGMSDVGLAKICRKHNVPVPPVGYWRRKETGYKVKCPPLPPAKDGREHLDIYIRERLRPEFEDLARQTAPKIAIAPDVSHPFALRSEKLLRRGKLNQRGLVIAKNGALSHILVSREQLPRALKILNALLLALEERNQPASWPKQENALLAVSIDDEAVRFSLSEITDSAPHILTPSEVNHPWSAPKYDYKLTRRLQLQIANLPPFMGPIRRTWADGKTTANRRLHWGLHGWAHRSRRSDQEEQARNRGKASPKGGGPEERRRGTTHCGGAETEG